MFLKLHSKQFEQGTL